MLKNCLKLKKCVNNVFFFTIIILVLFLFQGNINYFQIFFKKGYIWLVFVKTDSLRKGYNPKGRDCPPLKVLQREPITRI